MHSGGLTLSTLYASPVGCTIAPSASSRSQIASASSRGRVPGRAVAHEVDAEVEPAAVDGADRSGARPASASKPGAQARADVRGRWPAGPPPRARRARRGRSRTRPGRRRSSEKNGAARSNASAISRRQITAPTGWPLPGRLGDATMSGDTPCCSKAQKSRPCARSRPAPRRRCRGRPRRARARRRRPGSRRGSDDAALVAEQRLADERRGAALRLRRRERGAHGFGVGGCRVVADARPRYGSGCDDRMDGSRAAARASRAVDRARATARRSRSSSRGRRPRARSRPCGRWRRARAAARGRSASLAGVDTRNTRSSGGGQQRARAARRTRAIAP